MDALSDRIVAWLIRLVATALVFAGVALFVAGIPLLSSISGSARDILVVVLQIGAAFVVCGLAAIFASRLPPGRPADERPAGWTMALAVTLVAAPGWLLVTLQPFLSEWRVVAELLWSSELWKTANANMSGVVLLPIAAALVPPFIELAALVAAVLSSIVMIVLLLTKSRRFARLYLATVLLLTALVVGSVRGASVARMTGEALQPWIEESKPRPEEYAQIRGVLDRYGAAVMPTATALAWAWLGYAIWIPPVLLSARRR